MNTSKTKEDIILKKKVVSRMLTAICTVSLLTTGVVGFGVTAEAKSEDASAEGGKTLSLMVCTSWNTDALAEGISLYEEETGNKIEVETVPDEQIADLVKTRLATKTDVPDILADSNGYTGEQIKAYFEAYDGEWIDKLNPDHLETTYALQEDGNIYMAPYGTATATGLIYNKKIMEENGISLPIMSYSDLLSACETLKNNGVTPISISNKENWTAQMLLNGQVWDDFTAEDFEALKTGKLSYVDKEALKEAFENTLNLKDMGYINEDFMSTTMDMSIEDVATGECAMTPAGDWSYAALSTNFPDAVDNVGMIPSPIFDEAPKVAIGTSSKYMWVPKDGKNGDVDTAKEFVDFLMSDETMQAMCKVEPGICTIQGLEVESNSWDKEMLTYAEDLEYTKVVAELNGFNTGSMHVAIQQMLGGKSVEDALAWWYDDCVQINKAAGTEGF